jgi:diguanylate cyclase (GGDEF)-like protein
LESAHNRLEELANTDPLTAAFNRHAFYGFVRKDDGSEPVSGCVGFFDLDNLKQINDCYGHSAGDQAIRATARAIRDLIRAEDLLYRWGGDEFFVIMVGMDAEMAKLRMEKLERGLTDLKLEGMAETINVGVSSGFCNFNGASELEQSIKRADAEMYKRKETRKRTRPIGGFVHALPQAPSHLVA